MHCETYRCTIAETACAARHLKAKRELDRMRQAPEGRRFTDRMGGGGKEAWACGSCSVGAEMAKAYGDAVAKGRPGRTRLPLIPRMTVLGEA